MKRSPAVLLLLLLTLLTLPCLALAEADASDVATPAMDMSLEEAEAQGLLLELPVDDAAVTPFQPDTLEKTVIGADNRTSISSPGAYPYSAIAYMQVKARCGCEWTGSGFMVSRDCLMTGAHCVACTKHGDTACNITLYFGYKSGKNYLLKYDGATTYWYGTNFRDSQGKYNTDWDYAYVRLEKNVGDTTGWFGLTAMNDSSLSASTLEVAGYRHGKLKTSRGSITSIWDLSVYHSADTEPGNSGCPIFTDDYYAVAINVAENNDRAFNVGRRITSDLISEMRSKNLFD